MQVPILQGTYTNDESDYRTILPRNLMPVVVDSGLSAGYLRPAFGVESFTTGKGRDRGGAVWRGECYRLSGSNLIKVDQYGVVTTLAPATVPGTDQATFAISYNYLAAAANNSLYIYDGSFSFVQVTDPDLGTVISMAVVDDYVVATDGATIVVSDLGAPFAYNPLHYGSSEIDPDNISCLRVVRNELHAINRYTTEVFQNVGGTGFPFQRIEGAQIMRGTLGPQTATVLNDRLYMLGGGKNEPVSVWVAASGASQKIASKEIEDLLYGQSETELASAVVTSMIGPGIEHVHVRLKTQTLVYDAIASSAAGTPIWFTLDSGTDETRREYRPINPVWCYNKWIVGDANTSAIGVLTKAKSSHYGQHVAWEFGTKIIYNDGSSAIVHQLELVGLPGRAALGDSPMIFTQWSEDGETWSMPRGISAGKQGDRTKLLVWFQQGLIKVQRMQRFYGDSRCHASFARLNATVEPLAY